MEDQDHKPARCPGCGSGMQLFLAEEAEVDRCLFCGGIWLDKGELESLTRRTIPPGRERVRGLRPCARCEDVQLDRTTVFKIEVDACSQCGGVYLDESELQRIAGKEKPLLPLQKSSPPVWV